MICHKDFNIVYLFDFQNKTKKQNKNIYYMASICFYFQVHQPYRLRNYTLFDATHSDKYFDEHLNKEIFHKVANKCYLPANQMFLELLEKHPEFKICFSLSGVFLEQALKYHPEVIKSFQRLVETGQVEILSETYYHSLSSVYSKTEFVDQIKKHKKIIKELFHKIPKIFRNTELIYSDAIGNMISELGYKGMLIEGVDRILEWRSPNYLYSNHNNSLKLLLKNYQLSDDIAFRFSDTNWKEYPLTINKFTHWIDLLETDQIVNLFMDYETIGEHQWTDSGIFEFFKQLPNELLNAGHCFKTPSEIVKQYEVKDQINSLEYISWADSERDLSAWRSNPIQFEALEKLYSLEKIVKSMNNRKLLENWKLLTTSDHFYYMCTKFWADGDVHKYFSPYNSPFDAYIYFMNALKDLEWRILTSNLIENKKNKRNLKKKLLF